MSFSARPSVIRAHDGLRVDGGSARCSVGSTDTGEVQRVEATTSDMLDTKQGCGGEPGRGDRGAPPHPTTGGNHMTLDRHVCTADDPWTKEKSERAEHPDAKSVGGCRDGCCTDYRCPHCGKFFTIEYPD